MKEKHHPFYCHKKNCLKTAWDTPEYLTENDWYIVGAVTCFLAQNDFRGFRHFVLNNPYAKRFFYLAIGWPEGYNYCQSLSYCEKTAFPMMLKNDLEKLEKALTGLNK